MGLDLAQEQGLAAREDEGRVVHLWDFVTGELAYEGDVPVTVTVAGRLSARHRKAADAWDRGQMRRRNANADAATDRQNAILAACILGWQGLTLKGAAFEFTPKNVEVLVKTMPRLRDDLWVEVHDDAAFFAGNSTPS